MFIFILSLLVFEISWTFFKYHAESRYIHGISTTLLLFVFFFDYNVKYQKMHNEMIDENKKQMNMQIVNQLYKWVDEFLTNEWKLSLTSILMRVHTIHYHIQTNMSTFNWIPRIDHTAVPLVIRVYTNEKRKALKYVAVFSFSFSFSIVLARMKFHT